MRDGLPAQLQRRCVPRSPGLFSHPTPGVAFALCSPKAARLPPAPGDGAGIGTASKRGESEEDTVQNPLGLGWAGSLTVSGIAAILINCRPLLLVCKASARCWGGGGETDVHEGQRELNANIV